MEEAGAVDSDEPAERLVDEASGGATIGAKAGGEVIEMRRVAGSRTAVRAGRVVLCLLLVAALTWIGYSRLHVNPLIMGFIYVLSVLLIAARWGLLESLVTSFAATLCLNYFFLPPVLSLTIADPQNWVALFVFMGTAFTASQLSASVRKQASEALERRVEIERLYNLCVSLMLIDSKSPLGPQIAASVKEKCGFRAAAICESATKEIYLAGGSGDTFNEETLRTLAAKEFDAAQVRMQGAVGSEARVAQVSFGGRTIGSMAVMGNPISDAAMQAIAGLVAIGFESARQQIEFGRVEVARQNERLRSVLLDALAHDFLTPLTTVKSAITTVRTEYEHGSEEDDILAVIEEEADRLGELTNEATDMARIEAGSLRIQKRAVRIPELIDASLKRTKRAMEGRRVSVQIQEGIPNAKCDPEMLGLAIRQLLGNAAKYSPQETNIDIKAFACDGVITVQIADYGPGIQPEESSLIFERFYRGRHAAKSVTGTGMGLPIARDIVRAHEGELWAENVPGAGARFSFTVPAEK